MALKRSTMADKVRVISVAWEDETLDVGIRPGRYTPALVDRMSAAVRAAEEAEKAGDADAASAAVADVADATAEVIAWWDVLDDDGERLPVTREVLDSLPLLFVQHVMSEAGAAIRPPARKG